MNTLLIIWFIWFAYLMIGITWLYYSIEHDIIDINETQPNIIGTLLILIAWPISILYKIFKK